MGLLVGCDFSSSPSAKKPIVCARGREKNGELLLEGLDRLTSLAAFSTWLRQEPAWIGGFDFPFGLPRELLATLGWPMDWQKYMRHYASLTRAEIRNHFSSFCSARPVGRKFAHRITDRPAGSSPSMKWVNPPVAYMLHAGVPRLLDAGVYLPGVQLAPMEPEGRMRVALEAYPGLIAKSFLGKKSYKSDDKAKHSIDRWIARQSIVQALEAGPSRWSAPLKLHHAQRKVLIDDASGDSLDAVLCMLQAAWAQNRHSDGHPLYGLPQDLDPLEGWIVSA